MTLSLVSTIFSILHFDLNKTGLALFLHFSVLLIFFAFLIIINLKKFSGEASSETCPQGIFCVRFITSYRIKLCILQFHFPYGMENQNLTDFDFVFFQSTETVLSPEFAVTISGFPLPSISPIAT